MEWFSLLSSASWSSIWEPSMLTLHWPEFLLPIDLDWVVNALRAPISGVGGCVCRFFVLMCRSPGGPCGGLRGCRGFARGLLFGPLLCLLGYNVL